MAGDPLLHAVCHCNNCKRRTGSAFGLSAYFADTNVVRVTGPTAIYEVDNKEFGNRQQRHFCPGCGTTLFWKISTLPNLTGIAGGCFVEQPLPEPTHTVSNHGKCAWLELPSHWKTALAASEWPPK